MEGDDNLNSFFERIALYSIFTPKENNSVNKNLLFSVCKKYLPHKNFNS